MGVWSVALGGLLLILLFAWSFDLVFLDRMARVEAARGLITFLFAIATVGVAVIVVVAAFVGNGTPEELAQRFQRGKDVLTILIDVLGAILGFYFGSELRSQDGGQPLRVEQPGRAGNTEAGQPDASATNRSPAELRAGAVGDRTDTDSASTPAR